jgi:hypothetical protein
MNIPKLRAEWAKEIAKYRELKFLKKDRELVKKIDGLWRNIDSKTESIYKSVAVLIPHPNKANKDKATNLLTELGTFENKLMMEIAKLANDWQQIVGKRGLHVAKLLVPLTRLLTGNTPAERQEKAQLEWEAQMEKDLKKLGIEGSLYNNIVNYAKRERKANKPLHAAIFTKMVSAGVNKAAWVKLDQKRKEMGAEFTRFHTEMEDWVEEKMSG